MRRMNLKISLIIAIFFLAVVNQARAHPPCGAGYHNSFGLPGYGSNRCGPYGCNTLGMPVWQPGSQDSPTGGAPSTTTIIIKRK
jgi:hypothetical protein